MVNNMNIKSLNIGIIALLLLFTPALSAASSLSISDQSGLVSGGVATVDVNLVGASDIGSFNTVITFNPSLFMVTGISNGALTPVINDTSAGAPLTDLFVAVYNNTAGSVAIAYAGNGLTGSGSVAIITFSVIGSSGSSTLAFTDISATTSSVTPIAITLTTDNGLLTIGDVVVFTTDIYDTNGTPGIQKAEAVTALSDYLFSGTITKANAVAVLSAYLFG